MEQSKACGSGAVGAKKNGAQTVALDLYNMAERAMLTAQNSAPKRSAHKPVGPILAEYKVTQLPVDHIDVGKFNKRTAHDSEVGESIKITAARVGILNPLIARALPSGRYEPISGHVRLAGAKNTGLKTVPVWVVDVDDAGAWRLTLLEDACRSKPNPLDRARVLAKVLEETGASQAVVANWMGQSPQRVSQLLALLKLPQHIQDKLVAKDITEREAREHLAAAKAAASPTEPIKQFNQQGDGAEPDDPAKHQEQSSGKRPGRPFNVARAVASSVKGIQKAETRLGELSTEHHEKVVADLNNLVSLCRRLLGALNQNHCAGDERPPA